MKPDQGGPDAGFTLIELLVAISLSIVLGGIVLSTILAGQNSSAATTRQVDLTAEARTALNRISDDLSVAVPLSQLNADGTGTPLSAISSVQNPDGPGYRPTGVTSVTFQADFSGDGCVTGLPVSTASLVPVAGATPCPASSLSATAPDIETYCWDPAAQQLYLIPGPVSIGSCTPTTSGLSGQPLLAGKVTAFELFYRSSDYRYQGLSGQDPAAGETSWYDLDAAGAPVGNHNGVLDVELANIDSVTVSLTLSEAGLSQQFTTSVDLRNVHPGG